MSTCKTIDMTDKLKKQLLSLKKKDKDLYGKVLAAIHSLKTYRFESNTLVTKKIEKDI